MKRALFILLLFCQSFAFAQDPKFSQYFASPLTLNPALTGYFDGKYRVAINTRQQWANVGDPYNTYSASAEVKLRDEFYYEDIFSFGLNGVYDESFNKVLKSYAYSVSASYYKFMDPDHHFKFGLAPQVAYVANKLDYDALTVASQFHNGAFDLSIPNNLGLDNDRLAYFDFNVGANMAFSFDRFSAAVGYGAFHLTRPKASLFNDVNLKLPIKHAVNLSFSYYTQDLMDFNFSSHYMAEGNSSDIMVGGLMGFRPTIDSKFKLNTGVWYKTNEYAFFPYVGFEVANVSLGLNYSVFTRSIAGFKPRTFEISMIITDKNFTKFKNTCKF
ncbi:MAG: PorP/SprF family type IX secretion system membrane protein [Pedobacter sp.]|nr:PorP/SprF family type IX secretion system membrane protein [Pedobacter sp.]MDQ8052003.1 PorP/SprF family type IX secretion system membrane protein [Pedobacter sp.]